MCLLGLSGSKSESSEKQGDEFSKWTGGHEEEEESLPSSSLGNVEVPKSCVSSNGGNETLTYTVSRIGEGDLEEEDEENGDEGGDDEEGDDVVGDDDGWRRWRWSGRWYRKAFVEWLGVCPRRECL